MKNAKHTPGPWVVKDRREIAGSASSAGLVITKERGSLTFKNHTGHSRTLVAILPANPRHQFKANSQLIAAAPELLDALELLEKNSELGINHEYRIQARQAIAKAKGDE